jgi:hypothetical protein
MSAGISIDKSGNAALTFCGKKEINRGRRAFPDSHSEIENDMICQRLDGICQSSDGSGRHQRHQSLPLL